MWSFAWLMTVPDILEGEEFMACTAAHHEGAIEVFWLRGALMLSIIAVNGLHREHCLNDIITIWRSYFSKPLRKCGHSGWLIV